MKIIETGLIGAVIIEVKIFGDHRGFFMESYTQTKFHEAGIKNTFVQDNHSLSVEAGVLRGLHYQTNPKAQAKLIRVVSGAIYDVILDIRNDSQTFGKWAGVILSSENKRQLFVPKGFAHGFCTLAPNTEVIYKVDELYSPEHDRGIAWDDPELGIDWPVTAPVLSDKDRTHPIFSKAETNFKM
jgi:dTDP-4-dehydrorhamnose 3,5-epimerase